MVDPLTSEGARPALRRTPVAFAVALLLAACGAPPTPDLERFPEAIDLAGPEVLSAVRAETGLVDFGTPAARRHLVSGWATDAVFGDDGPTMVWGMGEASVLRFELLAPRRLTLRFRCRPLHWRGGPEQRLTVAVNGEPVDELELDSGFEDYRVTVPASALVPGVNLLTFRYAFSRAPHEIDPSSPDHRPLAVAWDLLRVTDSGGAAEAVGPPAVAEEGLFLPFGTGRLHYLELPAESQLTLGSVAERGGRGRLMVTVRFDGDGTDGTDGDGEARRWTVEPSEAGAVMALRSGTGGLAEIGFAAIGDDAGEAGGLEVRSPLLRHAGGASVDPAPMASRKASSATPAPTPDRPAPEDRPEPEPGRPPNLVVYLVDTLRADHLGCYGYPKPISPEIDAFARDALLFERTFAQSSWTRSAVASLFTGELPIHHGVLGRDHSLPEEAVTLAELLGEAGYASAGFVANGNVDPAFGFGQGFDHFERLRRRTPGAPHALAGEVHGEALAWLDDHGREPFFLYLHTLDPHAPYRPPTGAARRFARDVGQPNLGPEEARVLAEQVAATPHPDNPSHLRLGSMPWIRALLDGGIEPTPEIVEDLTALYDAEIYANDRWFGALIDALVERGLYRESLIVFVSDHGEELHDHGGWSHGRTLYGEQLRVPLIVKPPAASGIPVGRRIERLARQVDLLPTLLAAAGVPVPESVAGRGLLAPEGSDAGGERGLSYLDLDGRRSASWLEGRFKLLCPGIDAGRCRLFDLAADPGERSDLAPRRPVLAGSLWARLARELAAAPAASEATDAELDPELRRQLEALGYL